MTPYFRCAPLLKLVGKTDHFLLECPNTKLANARNEIIKQIGCLDPEFPKLNKELQARYILNACDQEKLKYSGTLCAKILKIFKEELKSIEAPVNPEPMVSVPP